VTAREAVAGSFCAVGAVFFILGTVGLLRMPDFYSRLHPSTKCDTLGGCSVLLGMMVHAGWSWDIPRLMVIAALLLLYSATCGHAVGRSAFMRGMPVWKKPGGEREETPQEEAAR